MRRLALSLGLLGILLSVAVGPGLSITRCLMTGEVQLGCCCAGPSQPIGIGATDDCCQFQHLERAWFAGLMSERAELSLPAALPSLCPAWTFCPSRLPNTRPSSEAESPPRVQRALRI